jgi:hypothetical protein
MPSLVFPLILTRSTATPTGAATVAAHLVDISLMHRGERWRDDGFRGSQEFDEDAARIEVAQARRLDDAAQDLLRSSAAWRAIAAGHLPIDDRRSKCLLSAPVRRIERRIKEKAEERRQFGGEMRRESVAVGQGTRRVKHVEQLGHEMTAGDGRAMRGDLARG